jgi:fatty acid desaturase
MTAAMTETFALPAARDLRLSVSGEYESTPWRLLRWAVFDWVVIVLTWSAMAALAHPIATVAGVLIVASRLHALGALLHDACHSRMVSRAWPLLESLAGWPIASTIAAMRYHHLRHHRDSGTATDPYRNSWIDRGPLFRLILVLRGALLPIWWTLRAVIAPMAAFSPGVRRFYARAFLQDRSSADLANSTEVRECMTADYRQLVAQSLVLATAVLSGFPLVEFYLIPWTVAGILNARRVLYEHAFESTADSSRQSVYGATFDRDAGPLLNLLLYPRNLSFHRAHHLYPTASFVHLPELTRKVHEALAAKATTGGTRQIAPQDTQRESTARFCPPR